MLKKYYINFFYLILATKEKKEKSMNWEKLAFFVFDYLTLKSEFKKMFVHYKPKNSKIF